MTKQEWLDMWHLSGKEGERQWQAKQDMHNSTPQSHTVINDIQPYKSMQTGEMITSRSAHKAHLKKHGLIEIGNEKMPERKPEVKYNSEEVKREIAKHIYR
jgi:hypothetical protein